MDPIAAAAKRGARLAFFATLALSLATAIAAAAWLIADGELNRMTATTMPNAAATPNGAASAAPAAPATDGMSAGNASSTSTTGATSAGNDATANGATTNAGTTAARDGQTNAITTAAATASASQTTAGPSAPVAPPSAGQRAFIDPVTGQLRQPEHDELAAIAAEAAAAASSRRLARTATAGAAQELFGPDGSVAAVVPEDLHTFTVATRAPDGRIVIEHAQGANNAAKLMKANSAKKSPQAPVSRAQQKEDRNDR